MRARLPVAWDRRPGLGNDRWMAPRAELSSLASTLDDLARRVTALAEEARSGGDDAVASELFGVERALAGALRRLRRLDAPRPGSTRP